MKYDLGTTVTIEAEFKNKKDQLIDPDATKIISISSGEVQIDGEDMIKDVTGVWYYTIKQSDR